jgi:hypothetical protein
MFSNHVHWVVIILEPTFTFYKQHALIILQIIEILCVHFWIISITLTLSIVNYHSSVSQMTFCASWLTVSYNFWSWHLTSLIWWSAINQLQAAWVFRLKTWLIPLDGWFIVWLFRWNFDNATRWVLTSSNHWSHVWRLIIKLRVCSLYSNDLAYWLSVIKLRTIKQVGGRIISCHFLFSKFPCTDSCMRISKAAWILKSWYVSTRIF